MSDTSTGVPAIKHAKPDDAQAKPDRAKPAVKAEPDQAKPAVKAEAATGTTGTPATKAPVLANPIVEDVRAVKATTPKPKAKAKPEKTLDEMVAEAEALRAAVQTATEAVPKAADRVAAEAALREVTLAAYAAQQAVTEHVASATKASKRRSPGRGAEPISDTAAEKSPKKIATSKDSSDSVDAVPEDSDHRSADTTPKSTKSATAKKSTKRSGGKKTAKTKEK